MENIVEDIEEFDIQSSVLKKRNVELEQKVYVEYDRMNYSVVSVSPISIEPSAKRNAIQIITRSELTNSIFGNKVPLSRLVVKKNKETKKFELQFITRTIKSEFDYVFATNEERSFIHINCDSISKNIEVIFDYEIFKDKFATENMSERDLEDLASRLEIYCIDKTERSRLFDTLSIDIAELFKFHSIRCPAPWLPNEHDQLKNIGFVYYNNNQKISLNGAPKITTNSLKYKSNILYSQVGNVLKLQSNMQNVTTFYIADNVMLYSYSKQDPTKMLGSYKVSRDQFNNYNYFEIKMKTSQKVKLVTDCFHLDIEESNVNSD
jgi:hypothetical protein